jgi:hypothetical protein
MGRLTYPFGETGGRDLPIFASVSPNAAAVTTDGIDTAVGAGEVPFQAAAAVTDGIDTAAAVGSVESAGAVAVTDGLDTVVGVGIIPVVGAVAITDGLDTAAAVTSLNAAAAVAVTDGLDTAAAVGYARFPGSLAATDGLDTVVGAGEVPTTATLAVTDGLDTAVGLGFLVDVIGLWTTDSTMFPARVGVSVLPSTVSRTYATATHTVIAGTTSRTAGAAAVLTGDYLFRGLYSFDTTLTVPGNFQEDARDWVTLGSWGPSVLKIRRDIGTSYRIRADFLLAGGATATWAAGQIFLDEYTESLGLGVTRDATTGAIKLWMSVGGWGSWTAIPLAQSSIIAGAMDDAVPEDIVVLGGDLQDGPWISAYQAQWAASTDIASPDADEVAAWNYGANIVTGIGGNFYDAINRTTKNLWELGTNTSYIYSQRSETTDAGTTVRADFTFNAPQLNTGIAPAGTESSIVHDPTPTWGAGPALSQWSPPILLQGNNQFTLVDSNRGVPTRGADGTPERYRVILVDIYGAPSLTLDNAVVGNIIWSLDETETFSFIMPINDADADISVADQEVQIWRGSELLIWGVVVRKLAASGDVEYQCKGLGWYFTKRFVGGPRINFLGNPSFETTGETQDWIYNQYAPTEDDANKDPANWSQSVVSTRSINGSPGRSLRIASNDIMDFGISAHQFFFHEIDSTVWPDGIKWTAAAWVYIPSTEWGYYDDETETVIGERNAAYNWGGESAAFGLHLARFSTTESQDQDLVAAAYPKVYEIAVAGLTEDTPRDQWVRIETSLIQPAEPGGGSRTDWMQVELHAPQGTVFYDEVSLTRNERLFFADVDQQDIMSDLITHAQDVAFGKSDLNIGIAAYPAVTQAVQRTRTYEFFNRELIADAIKEFSTLWNGCDWSIESDSSGQRLFTPHYPMKGTRRPAQALVLGRNIASVSVADDGELIANRVAVMSDGGGTGSSREESIATDTFGFASGLILEEAINAAKESPLDSLDSQVERALRQKRNGRIPTLTTYEGVGSQLLGSIQTGDIVPVEASHGGLAVSGDHRIVQILWDPKTETMDITLNPLNDNNDPMRPASAVRLPSS